MAKNGCIEYCTDCCDSVATGDVMWQSFPVPWFGNLASKQVEVATVGLNPSWTEFVTSEKVWRDLQERLPAVMDVGTQSRGEITWEQAKQVAKARETYFTTTARKPHPWFKNMQGIMSGAKMKFSYVSGTAVHLDLVACATWQEWGTLAEAAKAVLVNNCFPKFVNTLKRLRPTARLLLDGRTVFETVTTRCEGVVESAMVVGVNPGLEVWRGKLSATYGAREFLAWSNPVKRQKNQQPLVEWLRRQAR